ncbi:DivIVA domain-containing protein [Micromonospora rosaria]|uniref:DivIVA domain-containing protein n=1 Tax=Micromonospora rosaria TaxID=47874 RepID=UPI000B2D4BC9|nr:DivIVA domain-containing protein [Micromonospora rosaria]
MTQVYRSGQPCGAGHPHHLTPHEVRTWQFDPRRRGVDADQVHRFQTRVADELTILHEEVRLLHQENDRLGRALRDWQIMHARECRPPEESTPPNRGHW